MLKRSSHLARGAFNPDERLREKVTKAIAASPQIDQGDIDVFVHDGEVLLEGTVHGRAARQLAEDLARSVAGVKTVQNRINVQPSTAPLDAAAPVPRGIWVSRKTSGSSH